jgi:hypothetical protein
MEEIAGFVGNEEGQIYNGLAALYSRIEKSEKGNGEDVEVLAKFVAEAKKRQ